MHQLHQLREMRPGDTTTIPHEDNASWLKESRRATRETGLRFKFTPFLDIGIDVECLPRAKRGAPIKHKEIHGLEPREKHEAPRELAQTYRSAIANIERTTDKRFLVELNGETVTVTRLPDLANKKDYRVPKNKYGLGEIAVGSYRKFDYKQNLMAVSRSVDEFSRRTNGCFRFQKRWLDGDLYVYRFA
jgi:hypothetical protein